MKKIWQFIYRHPIWSIVITWLLLYFTASMITHTYNPGIWWFVTLFIYALLGRTIRKARHAEKKQKESDYQAKQIAIELHKLQTANNSPQKGAE